MDAPAADSTDLQTINALRGLVEPARLERFEQALAERVTSVTAVIEDLCDPRNIAAVARTVEALGLQDLHVVARAGEVRLGRMRHTALGAQRWLTVHRHDRLALCLGELQAAGFEVWGADVRPGAEPLAAINASRPVALVFGSERVGLSRVARRHVDRRFRIPLAGLTSSLNVSAAAAISLHHAVSRRREALAAPGDMAIEQRQALLARWLRQSVRRSEQVLQALQARREEGHDETGER